MLKKLCLLMIIPYLLLTTGCVAVMVGAGAGAGAFAYVNGQLSRTYQANYEKTYAVCKDILNDLKQPILEEKTDGIKTTLRTKRADETPMTVSIRIIEPDWTEVAVRTGYVGVWKREISEQYHEFVARRIK